MINQKLNNWFIAGLMDAEGCFGLNIIKDNTRKLGYILTVYIELGMNFKDKALIYKIKETLESGNIYYNSNDKTYKWKVSNIDQINNRIIPHFNKYFLLTQKRADFEIFTKVVSIIKANEHLTFKGLQEIVNLKASLNQGLSDKLKESFPNVIPVSRSIISFDSIPDPNWLLGFAEGEACFFVSLYKSPKSKLGLAVQLVFKLTQHTRDVLLLKGLINFFDCGRIEYRKDGKSCDFTVNSFKDFENKIIPFFLKYPFQGSKLLNFEDFYKVFTIMLAKGHLTKEGMDKIKIIKARMNIKRKWLL